MSIKGKNPTHSPVNAVSRKWRASKGVDRLMPRLVGGMGVTHQLKDIYEIKVFCKKYFITTDIKEIVIKVNWLGKSRLLSIYE